MKEKTRNELRCFCRRRPLLATYGLDDSNKVYVHVKVYKNRRIYGEIVVREGSSLSLRCRECLRWYGLEVGKGSPILKETTVPNAVELEAPVDHV